MPDITAVADVLTRLGFTAHLDHPAVDPARVASLSENGPYVVLGAWQKGDTIVHVEQNTAPEAEEADGSRVTVTHPPVLVVANTKSGGSYACSFGDLEAFERIVNGDVEYEVK
jgi:hypothetical protein